MFSEENQVPRTLLKWEKCQGPPNVNKVKRDKTVVIKGIRFRYKIKSVDENFSSDWNILPKTT